MNLVLVAQLDLQGHVENPELEDPLVKWDLKDHQGQLDHLALVVLGELQESVGTQEQEVSQAWMVLKVDLEKGVNLDSQDPRDNQVDLVGQDLLDPEGSLDQEELQEHLASQEHQDQEGVLVHLALGGRGASLGSQDLQDREVNKVCVESLDFQPPHLTEEKGVSQGQLDPLDNLERLALGVREAHLDQEEPLVRMVLQDPLGCEERMDLQDQLAHQDNLVLQALLDLREKLDQVDQEEKGENQAHLVDQDNLDPLDHKDSVESLGRRDRVVDLDHQDPLGLLDLEGKPDPEDHPVLLVQLESVENQVSQDQVDHQETEVSQEHLVLLVKWVHRDQLDLQDHQDQLDKEENQVHLVHLVQEANQGQMDHQDLEGIEENQEQLELQEQMDGQDHKVLLVQEESLVREVNLVELGLLGNQDHQVSRVRQEGLVKEVKQDRRVPVGQQDSRVQEVKMEPPVRKDHKENEVNQGPQGLQDQLDLVELEENLALQDSLVNVVSLEHQDREGSLEIKVILVLMVPKVSQGLEVSQVLLDLWDQVDLQGHLGNVDQLDLGVQQEQGENLAMMEHQAHQGSRDHLARGENQVQQVL